MASKYSALSIDLIDEGRFVKEINDATQKAAKGLLEYQRKHGKDRTRGAKATVTVKVTIAADKETDAFMVRGDIQEKIPSRPPVIDLAIEECDDAGNDTLFMRKTGGTADSPRQGVLTTREGEVVDQVTGEVRGKRKAAGE